MKKNRSLITAVLVSLLLTSSAYAVDIDNGANNTVTGSTEYTVIGNKLKMKNSNWSTMIGRESEMENASMGLSVGVYNKVKGFDAMAIGNHNEVDGTNADNSRNWISVAVGSGCVAKSHGDGEAVAMGVNSEAIGQDAVSFGDTAKAHGYHAVAIGTQAMVFASNGVAVGSSTYVYGIDSLAIGSSTTNVYGKYSIGINAWTVKGDNVIGIGGETYADDAIAIGKFSTTNVKGGIALGKESLANIDKGVLGWDPATMNINLKHSGWSVWESTAGAVSVGNSQYKRQITNVAAGTSSDDAVNVAQLRSLAEVVHGNNVIKGSINNDGTITLVKKDGSKVNLTGKLKDNSVKPGEYNIEDNKVTLEVKDHYSGNKLGNVVIKDVAKASDLQKEKDNRIAGDTNIHNMIGSTNTTELHNAYQHTTYISNAQNLIDADKKLDAAIKKNSDSITNINTKINEVTNNITNVGKDVKLLGDRVNKVGAGSAALAALHPLEFNPDDKWDFAVGYGNYRNANAVALGVFYRPSENVMFSLGSIVGNGNNMFNAGLSVKFGKSSNQFNYVSNKKLVEQINTLTEENKQLKDKVERLTMIVEQLVKESR